MSLQNMQIWNGKEWETKFMSMNPGELENIRQELENYGFRAIIVGDGYLPKKSSNLEENIVRALLENK